MCSHPMYRLPPVSLLIEAQTSPTVPAPQPAPAPGRRPSGTYGGIAATALLVWLALLAARKLF